MTSYKPAGYPSLSPYVIVTDAQASLSFIEKALGGERLRAFPDEEGRMLHAEIRVEDCVIMIADSGDGWEAGQAYLHWYVEDVDAVWRRALENGAEPVQTPVKKEDADKRGGFRDPGGITWWIGTQIDPE